MEFPKVMLRGGKKTIPEFQAALWGEPWGGGCAVLSPQCLGRVSAGGAGDEGRMRH